MFFHPHLHCIVPTRGWDDKNQVWIAAKQLKKGFFIPQKVLSACFKKHFLAAFASLWEEDKLLLPKELMHLNNPDEFRQFYAQIAFKKNWIVKVMPPLDNPQRVIEYLGRSVYRIAITDSRIKDINTAERKVLIEYKDYAAQTKDDTVPPVKMLSLDAPEFIRRFSHHVLPLGFQKIRYFGIYATACRKKLLPKIAQTLISPTWQILMRTVCEILTAFIGHDPNVCPCCGAKNLITVLLPPVKEPNTQFKKSIHINLITRPPPSKP